VYTDASIGAVTGWNWNFGNAGTSSQQNPSFVYTTPGVYNARLVVNDAIPCYDTAYHSIRVDSIPYMTFTQDKHAICSGERINFTTNYLSTAYNLRWDFGDGTVWNQFGNTAHNYDQPGLYFVKLTGDYGVCGIANATDSVVVNAFPKVDLGPDSVLCLDGPAILVTALNNANDPTITWLWNTGATTPSLSIVHPGIYSLTATKNDCATTENIEVNKDCYTDIPNAFTPNGDGVNDYFYPRQLLSKGVVGFSMTVYDRWGQKVFETTNTNGRGWDGKFNGKDQPMGAYIYQIKAVLKNGRIEDYKGNVTLVR
jgi:gliding motility-associated-like protein